MAKIQSKFCIASSKKPETRNFAVTFVSLLKFIYFEKATKFCEISTVDLSYVVTVKSTVEISQNFVAFSEYMNFNNSFLLDYFEFKQKLKLFKLFGTGYFLLTWFFEVLIFWKSYTGVIYELRWLLGGG